MKTNQPINPQPIHQPAPPKIGLPVRTGLRAGAWQCNTCVGTVNGNTLFKPTCEYCQPV